MSDWENMLKDNEWSDIMIIWHDEMNWWNSESKTIRRIFLSKRDLFDQMIWSFDLINWILSHYIIIQFFMHERFDHESHLLIWDNSHRRFFINLLISRRVVLRWFNRNDIFKSRWFLSYLLIFEIVERLMSTKMNMRFWWNQIEVTTELEDDFDQKKIISWRSKISILREISMNHEMCQGLVIEPLLPRYEVKPD
jgi:hypothetical protein